MSDRLKAALGIGLGVGLGLLAAELACRVFVDWVPHWSQHPSSVYGLPYENVPRSSYRDRLTGIQFSFNRWGVRGGDFPLQKPAGERRVLLLGDSIALGAAVPLEQTAGALIERELAPRAPVRVINSGVASYNLWDYYFYFQGRGRSFQPDKVVLFLCMNDSSPKAFALPMLGAGQGAPLLFRAKSFLNRSRLVWLSLHYLPIRDTVIRLARLCRPGPKPPAAPSAAGPDPVLEKLDRQTIAAMDRRGPDTGLDLLRTGYRDCLDPALWPHALPVFDALQAAVARQGRSLTVVIFPLAMQTVPGYRNSDPQLLLGQYLRQRRIDFIDLLPVFRRAVLRSGKRLYADELHPNALGYRIAARELLPGLSRDLGLAPGRQPARPSQP